MSYAGGTGILRGLMALRALIVDDDLEFLATARLLLERGGLEVVGVASTGSEALRLNQEQNPDVILVDINLGQESGLDLTERLTEATPNPPPVVLVSLYAEEDVVDLLDVSSARGFISKAQLSAETIVGIIGHGNRPDRAPAD